MATIEQLMAQYGVAWFGFDEASGNVLNKLSSNYIGTITGTTRVQGWNDVGNAMSGNTTSTTKIQFNSSIIPNGEKTVRFKIKIISYRDSIIVTRTQGTQGNGLQIGVYNSYLYVNIYNKATIIVATALSKILDLNKWYDIMFSWDGTTNIESVKLYLDEKLDSKSTATSLETAVSLHNMSVLGHYTATGYSLDGQIDDLQIYNKALSPSDFEQKRLAIKTSNNQNLVLSSTRVKEIPNTEESMLLDHGGVIKEIDSAVDSLPIDLTKILTKYEVTSNTSVSLNNNKVFTVPINTNFKTISIEDNY